MRGSCSIFISTTEEVLKASQASLKRQFTLYAAEFRGQVSTILEKMNAYMRVLLQYNRCMRADIVLSETKQKPKASKM